MKKVLLVNLDLLKEENYGVLDEMQEFIREMEKVLKDGNKVCFFSRKLYKIQKAREKYKEHLFKFEERDNVNRLVQQNRKNYFVVIGTKEVDFYLAVHNKLLLIAPKWIPREDKVRKYGISVDSPKQLFKFIQTLNNQNYWYSRIKVDEITTVISLMDARYKCHSRSNQEREMIEHFENLLKNGESRSYYEILLYHFLAGMTNTELFNDIEIWGIIPSSDTTLNDDMFDFKEKVRCINGKQEPKNAINNNVLIRYKEKEKAHYQTKEQRQAMGAVREFETLCVNPKYKEKINRLKKQNKFNVCIFDDYITWGNTSEAVRNIFETLGANKIIIVTLGSFRREYVRTDYQLYGDLYNVYSFTKGESISIPQKIEDNAKQEVEVLYKIFNS